MIVFLFWIKWMTSAYRGDTAIISIGEKENLASGIAQQNPSEWGWFRNHFLAKFLGAGRRQSS